MYPNAYPVELLAFEKFCVRLYIDGIGKKTFIEGIKYITDTGNHILRQRSPSLETAPTVGKCWTTRFIKRHKYNKAHQMTLASEGKPMRIQIGSMNISLNWTLS